MKFLIQSSIEHPKNCVNPLPHSDHSDHSDPVTRTVPGTRTAWKASAGAHAPVPPIRLLCDASSCFPPQIGGWRSGETTWLRMYSHLGLYNMLQYVTIIPNKHQ